MKYKHEALTSGGTSCPYCNGKFVEGCGSFDFVDNGIVADIQCSTCEKTWHENYELVDITKIGEL